MELNQRKRQLKQLIPLDFTEVITQCEALLRQDSDTYNELIVIQTQYKDALQKYRINHIDQPVFMQLASRQTTALLQLVDNITEYDLIDHEAEEIDLASGEKQQIDENEFIAVEEIQQLFSSAYDGNWKWFNEKVKERAFFALAAERYGREIWRQYNSMRVFGMTEDVPLDDLFVRVNILEKTQDTYKDSVDFLEKNFDRGKRKIKFGEKRNTKTGIETINTIKNLMVLGKPGAGKSTYLKFLALQSIKQKSDITERKVPIFITLKDLADKGSTLIQFISDQFRVCTLEDASLFVAQLLTAGKCLILLDGLDEVQEERKNDIIQEIIDLSEKYPKNQFVVSCRVAAYNAWFMKFTDVEMSDFDDKQIEAFITKWFHQEPETGKSCSGKLKKEPPLKELAAIPLLLTLLCIAYDENLDFHASRAELYEEAINALLKKWDSSRRIKRFEPYKNLSLARKRSLFSRIAAQTFEEGKYFLKRKEIVKLIAEYVQNIPGIKDEETSDVAGDVFDAIVANHGIFVPRAKGIYSFAHLTFQEYFTARYISENSTEGSTSALIKNHIKDDKWREVFLLTTSMLDKADQFLLQIHEQANVIFEQTPEIDVYFKFSEKLLSETPGSYSMVVRKFNALYILLAFAKGDFGAQARDNADLAAKGDFDEIFTDLSAAASKSAHTLGGAIIHILALAGTLASTLNPDSDFASDLDLSLASALTRANTLTIGIDFDIDLTRDRALSMFLRIKLRLIECLHTECYVSSKTQRWLIDNLLVMTGEEKV